MTIEKQAVRFATQKTVTIIDSCNSMNTAEKSDAWYSFEELDQFKKDAKAYAKILKESGDHDAIKTSSISFRESLQTSKEISPCSFGRVAAPYYESSPKSIARREITRGLEQRIDTERPKNKYIARMAVLEAQRRIKLGTLKSQKTNISLDPAIYLSIVASRFSRWAKEIALVTGKMDALDAYPTLVVNTTPAQEEAKSRCRNEVEIFVAPRKKARISLDGSGLITMSSRPIIGEEIRCRKNFINVCQQPVLVSGVV